MNLLIAISLFVTATTAFIMPHGTCEQRGGVYRELEPVDGGEPTKVCMPDLMIVQVDDD